MSPDATGKNGVAFDLEFWARSQRPPLYNNHAMLGRMTIDTKGRLWVPLHGGSHVLQINPRFGEVMQAIRIPAVKVTACVFGDLYSNALYVSTLAFGANEKAPAGDQGGSIFRITQLNGDVNGHAAWPFVIYSL
ncbi:regucalcin-like [Belonocnema kinseyi]|uniref:regucalcin-like n=1 Tax=Belonocnema kinseyi TaxID=2817044 RepID=UPI00143CD520|nr:regucalcin-like [Belonocnema kinseyi]